MAFAMKFPDEKDLYANVHFSVGGRSNVSDDITLVKTLLYTVYLPGQGIYRLPSTLSLNPLKLDDGVFSRETSAVIKHYQSTFMKKKRPDGIVSRCNAPSFSKAQYFTIISLNIHAERALLIMGSNYSLVDWLGIKSPILAVKLSVPHVLPNL